MRHKSFFFDAYCRPSQIASTRPSIICLGYDPNLGYEKPYFGCDKLLPYFEIMSDDPGFRGISFYRVDCDESPDIWKFCGRDVYVSVFHGRGSI